MWKTDGLWPQLGVPFPIVLEAPHIINMDAQVWARAISAGPDGKPLIVRMALGLLSPSTHLSWGRWVHGRAHAGSEAAIKLRTCGSATHPGRRALQATLFRSPTCAFLSQATFRHTGTAAFQDATGDCILQLCKVRSGGLHRRTRSTQAAPLDISFFFYESGRGPIDLPLCELCRDPSNLKLLSTLQASILEMHVLSAALQAVPDGVLVFLPSYGLMHQLTKRWQVRLIAVAQPT